jgi:hypothetical protein
VQEDPTGYNGGPNVYAYVDGQPLEARDPTGTEKANVIDGFIAQCYSGGSCLDAWGNITHGGGEGSSGGGGGGGGGSYSADRYSQIVARMDWNMNYGAYDAAYKRERAAAEDPNHPMAGDLRTAVLGSTEISFNDYKNMGEQVSQTYFWGVHSDQGAFDAILGHFVDGDFAWNNRFVDANRDSGGIPDAYTVRESFTVLHTKILDEAYDFTRVSNILYHETLHSLGFREAAACQAANASVSHVPYAYQYHTVPGC